MMIYRKSPVPARPLETRATPAYRELRDAVRGVVSRYTIVDFNLSDYSRYARARAVR